METYDSEQEQVEAIKKWWKENGRSVIAGLVIGLGGMVGWKFWVAYQETRAVGASTAYDQLLQIIDDNRHEEARQHGDRLVQEYPRSAYAGLSSLMLARVALDQGDTEAARHHLQWVVGHASLPELKSLAPAPGGKDRRRLRSAQQGAARWIRGCIRRNPGGRARGQGGHQRSTRGLPARAVWSVGLIHQPRSAANEAG